MALCTFTTSYTNALIGTVGKNELFRVTRLLHILNMGNGKKNTQGSPAERVFMSGACVFAKVGIGLFSVSNQIYVIR